MHEVAVIGAGPAGLMAALVCADAGLAVSVYDAMPAPGRKFLVAGGGGLNLTHSEPLERFVTRYGAAASFFAPLLARFGPAELRAFVATLGIETFVGSSGRVFPHEMKGAALLHAWIDHLKSLGVRFHLRHRWRGFAPYEALAFAREDGEPVVARPAATVLALGGASWPQTGSDGGWASFLAGRGVQVHPFLPSNCAFHVTWSAALRRHEGRPLKNVALAFAGQRSGGELVLTASGIEGQALYPLTAALRDALARGEQPLLHLDLKPDLPAARIADRLRATRGADSWSNRVRKALRLAPAAIALLREGADEALLRDPAALAERVRALPLRLTGIATLAEAISTAGGIALGELDERLMLRRLPGIFVSGEMLDWEAPTGGYLLQGCCTTGWCAGEGARDWVRRLHADPHHRGTV